MRAARISCPLHLVGKRKSLEAMIIFSQFNLNENKKKLKNELISSSSSFILGEANQLALDFRTVCESDFPTKITADYVARHHSDPNEISTRRNMVLAAK